MTNFNFIYVEKSRVISRTYGGSTYVMQDYEVVKGELIPICEVKACTRGHMGENHEVWAGIKKAKPELVKLLGKRAKRLGWKDGDIKQLTTRGYWWYRNEELGVTLKQA